MRVYTIVGARPQFIKAAVVSRALKAIGIEEVFVHTGQHYDEEMSGVFFEELEIPPPAVNLNVGSGTHAVQTGAMMVGLEDHLAGQPAPDWMLVYGDTNSTLAGALVAAKLNLPLAHVEAGLRSFNRRMPEEVNRVVIDRVSDVRFCPTRTAVENLRREGITEGVHLTGDVMLEAVCRYADRAAARAPLEKLVPYRPGAYALATVHRAENTDEPTRLASIFEGLGRLPLPVLLPLHPRTRLRLEGLPVPENVELLAPVGYLAMLTLVRNARCVLTDSGGLQKEAPWLGVPCITLRDETEWVETRAGGWNQVVGADAARIGEAFRRLPVPPAPAPAAVRAAERVAALLVETKVRVPY